MYVVELEKTLFNYRNLMQRVSAVLGLLLAHYNFHGNLF